MLKKVSMVAVATMVAVVALAEPKSPARVQVMPGVLVDWEHGVLEASGSCSADLFSASADIARIKAERLARLHAEERLRKALHVLSHDEKQRARLSPYGGAEAVAHLDPALARNLTVAYAASGSVSLRLGLALARLAGGDLGDAHAGADGGTDLGAAP
jgi:hypothetical protein